MKSKQKINEDRAAVYLAEHHKEISNEIRELSAHKNFAGILQAVVNLIRCLLEKGEFTKITRHIRYIGWIYQRGNDYIRYIIENLFVRSFEGIRRRCSPNQWQQLYTEIPKPFQVVYLTQNNIIIQKIKI
ncbi:MULTISPECIES: DUF7674 family protein [Bacteroidota]|uniref:DUF7674 domain-containing protein n=1 Tax=Pseudopedobacter saltans (strain ATCC 51119 / DSM 12145 / JCM 21818 / CCUG 39354 / LMG 10337 / NBRC 100064 / NCIMB 13643) TaxID=762903 RepID=F0S639_PSESL|nr:MULTISPECIES: hypothetical protein [Bacteroidota]ADY52142.1 hypothetical protein Pedsa_1583 [Pseudopedobacter saltans DSM 12145]RQP09412.1 MAG: hypothetical protein EAS48_08710 [Chryseobacterium sp.]UBB89984.1 hypothetical protein J4771_01130 [Candidatus Kaistella beijingensis]